MDTLRIFEGFLKPVSQDCMELFRMEICGINDSKHFPSAAKSSSTCAVLGMPSSGASLACCVTQSLVLVALGSV